MAKPGRFYVVKYTPDAEEYFEVSSKEKALALAAKLRKRGHASAFERRDVGSVLIPSQRSYVTPRKRTPPTLTLTQSEASAALAVLHAPFVGDEADTIAYLGEDRRVHAACRRAIKKLARIANGE